MAICCRVPRVWAQHDLLLTTADVISGEMLYRLTVRSTLGRTRHPLQRRPLHRRDARCGSNLLPERRGVTMAGVDRRVCCLRFGHWHHGDLPNHRGIMLTLVFGCVVIGCNETGALSDSAADENGPIAPRRELTAPAPTPLIEPSRGQTSKLCCRI